MFGCFADGLQDPTVVVFPDESVSPEGPRASELPCLAERFLKKDGGYLGIYEPRFIISHRIHVCHIC
jgi:hypothetical protein